MDESFHIPRLLSHFNYLELEAAYGALSWSRLFDFCFLNDGLQNTQIDFYTRSLILLSLLNLLRTIQ